MSRCRISNRGFLAVQMLVFAVVAVSFVWGSSTTEEHLRRAILGEGAPPEIEVPRRQPLQVSPLYNEPEVVSDRELAAVLKQIRPKFPRNRLKPNHVEHALRTWSVKAEFRDPEVLSGEEMCDFLTDHGKYLASWGKETEPLLQEEPQGVAIRWGRETGASVHHDHWLASLTEAGIGLDEPVFTPSRRDMTIRDVLVQALSDFHLDERETEWSAMAFGLWLPPIQEWRNASGRKIDFDLLAKRLLRGHKRFGVCSGTHRVYSLMLLLRLDDEFGILSKKTRQDVYAHLETVRDLITVSQLEDGSWPSNWYDGARAVEEPLDAPVYKRVIATGHHLEWLAIAPQELHPPREQIVKAADWLIATTVEKTEEGILDHYTFYSHVGNALALWRGTHPADFWIRWQKEHPPHSESE